MANGVLWKRAVWQRLALPALFFACSCHLAASVRDEREQPARAIDEAAPSEADSRKMSEAESEETSEGDSKKMPHGGFHGGGMNGYPPPGMNGHPPPGMNGHPPPGMSGYPQPGMNGYPQPGMNGHLPPGNPGMNGHPPMGMTRMSGYGPRFMNGMNGNGPNANHPGWRPGLKPGENGYFPQQDQWGRKIQYDQYGNVMDNQWMLNHAAEMLNRGRDDNNSVANSDSETDATDYSQVAEEYNPFKARNTAGVQNHPPIDNMPIHLTAHLGANDPYAYLYEDENLKARRLYTEGTNQARQNLERTAQEMSFKLHGVTKAADDTHMSLDRYDEHVHRIDEQLNNLDSMLRKLDNIRERQYGEYEEKRMKGLDDLNPMVQDELHELESLHQDIYHDQVMHAHGMGDAVLNGLNMTDPDRMILLGSEVDRAGMAAPLSGHVEHVYDAVRHMNDAALLPPAIHPAVVADLGPHADAILPIETMHPLDLPHGMPLPIDVVHPVDVVGEFPVHPGELQPDVHVHETNVHVHVNQPDAVKPVEQPNAVKPVEQPNAVKPVEQPDTNSEPENDSESGSSSSLLQAKTSASPYGSTSPRANEDGRTLGEPEASALLATSAQKASIDDQHDNPDGWASLDTDHVIQQAGDIKLKDDAEAQWDALPDPVSELQMGPLNRARYYRDLAAHAEVERFKKTMEESDRLDRSGKTLEDNAKKTVESLVNAHKKTQEWHDSLNSNIRDLNKFEGNFQDLRKTMLSELKGMNRDRVGIFDKYDKANNTFVVNSSATHQNGALSEDEVVDPNTPIE